MFDSELPYWRSQVDVTDVIEAHGHSPDRAAKWLAQYGVENRHAVMMRGLFYIGALNGCYHNTIFRPYRDGDLAVVMPTPDRDDLIAISRHFPRWNLEPAYCFGPVTGRAEYIGSLEGSPLRVHSTAANWLTEGCKGVLPLRTSFFPQLQAAPKIVADHYDHATNLAERVWYVPCDKFGGDFDEAQKKAMDHILICEH